MDQQKITEVLTNPAVETALKTVNERAAEFEASLDRLLTHFDGLIELVKGLIGFGQRSKQKFDEAREKTATALEPVLAQGRSVAQYARNNPRTVLFGAALLAGGVYLLVRAAQSSSETAGSSAQDEVYH